MKVSLLRNRVQSSRKWLACATKHLHKRFRKPNIFPVREFRTESVFGNAADIVEKWWSDYAHSIHFTKLTLEIQTFEKVFQLFEHYIWNIANKSVSLYMYNLSCSGKFGDSAERQSHSEFWVVFLFPTSVVTASFVLLCSSSRSFCCGS